MHTVQDVLDDVRAILQDKLDPYRYPTDELLMYINTGLYEIKRLRPDIWLSKLTLPETELPRYTDTPADLASVLPFNSMYYQSLVFYIAGYSELRDDEFTQDARAGILLKAFSLQLTRVGASLA